MACNECCSFYTLLLLRSCETARDATERSDYNLATTIATEYAHRYVRKLDENCKLPTDKMRARLNEAMSFVTQADIAHDESVFSKIGLSLAAEGTFSKEAQASFNMVVAELENAVRERARELNCEI